MKRRFWLVIAVVALVGIPSVVLAFKPRFQSALQSYTFNNAVDKKATLFFHVIKSSKKADPFRQVKVAAVGPHERKDGSKAVNYDSADSLSDFALSVELDGELLGQKQFAIVNTTNNPHEGNLVNPHTEKIFVSVIAGPHAVFVMTTK